MTQPEIIARTYLESITNKDFDRCASLLSPSITFDGPASHHRGPADILAAFRRITAIHVRNDIVKLFSDGNDVCVIYDFVTDTVGTLPTIEWLTIADNQIQRIKLYYDQVVWTKMRDEMARRAKA
jgi:hypothetical protein